LYDIFFTLSNDGAIRDLS